ncbi:radical SAM protein [bacterium]|nr:MAG: radical SAM protein [bacterium]
MDIKKISRVSKNSLKSAKNLAIRNSGKPMKPRWLVFMPTGNCNSHCQHCNIWQNPPKSKPLSLKEITQALQDPLFKNICEIINTGGEVSLRNDLAEIIYIEHKILPKAKLQMSTNALLPQKILDVSKRLLKNNIPISIGVSLDGIGEKHDKIRGVPGNFKKADFLLKELVSLRKKYSKNLEFAIGFTLSDLTLESLNEVNDYGKKLDIDVLVQYYNQSPFYGNNNSQLNINKKLYNAVASFEPSFLKEMWLSSLKGKFFKFPCFALNTFFVLTWAGDIVPCLNYFDISAGNIREKNPSEIWKSKEAQQIRKMAKRCKGCLNQWAYGWSLESCTFPVFSFYLKNPKKLIERFKQRGIE